MAALAGARLLSVLAGTLLVGALLVSTGCGDDSPTAPTDTAVVTFRVSDETFRVLLETAEQVRAAEAALAGGSAKIPNGRIVLGTDVNIDWSWHLEDVEFASTTIEVCDGRPSDVEAQGVSFGAGRFCPWSAEIMAINYQ